MLRIVGLALLLVIVGAAPAAGNDSGRGGKGMASARQQSATALGEGWLFEQHTPAMRVTDGLTTAPWPPRDSVVAVRREVVDQPAGLAVLASERRQRSGSWMMPGVSSAKSGLRLPVTGRLSVALGYERVQGEDLWGRYAEAASLDYDSHDFLLRAYWRF
jgi:hypothetical protein